MIASESESEGDDAILGNDDESDSDDEEYTEEGNLLKTLQDRAHHYARVHLRRVVGDKIWSRVAEAEREAKANPAGTGTHNQRMAWATYRSMVTEDLQKANGLHECMLVLSLMRESGDTARGRRGHVILVQLALPLGERAGHDVLDLGQQTRGVNTKV